MQINNGNLALAVFDSSGTNTATLFEASGTVSLQGVTGLTLSGAFSAQYNNTGAQVTETISFDGNSADNINLSVADNTNPQPFISLSGSNVTLAVGTFVSLTGDFGIQETSNGGVTTLAVAAKDINGAMAVGPASLYIAGASLDLLVVTASSSTPAVGSVALLASGGTDTLTGVPGLTLTANGMKVLYNNTGADPTTLPGATEVITTPDGNLTLNFSGLGASNIAAVLGSATMELGTAAVPNMIALNGDFQFLDFTPGGGSPEMLVSADISSAKLGTASTYLSITNANLVLLVVPGAAGVPTTFALSASGGADVLMGITGRFRLAPPRTQCGSQHRSEPVGIDGCHDCFIGCSDAWRDKCQLEHSAQFRSGGSVRDHHVDDIPAL